MNFKNIKIQKLLNPIVLIFTLLINTIGFSQTVFFPVFRAGKFGVTDTSLIVVLPIIYDFVEIHNDKLISARKGNQFLLFNNKGHEINNSKYDTICFDKSNLIITKRNNFYGLLNPEGKKIFDEKYNKIKVFGENSVCLKIQNQVCLYFIQTSKFSKYFDKISNPASDIFYCENGNRISVYNSVADFQTPFFQQIEKKNANLFFMSDSVAHYVYDTHEENKLQKTSTQYYFNDNTFYAYKIDSLLKIRSVFDNRFLEIRADSIVKTFDFKVKTGGMSSFIKKDEDKMYWAYYSQGKCGLIDQNLKIVLPSEFDFISKFDEEIKVVKNSKPGICDKDGNAKLPPIYDNFTEQNGLYMILRNGRFGIYQNNKECIPPIYEKLQQQTPQLFSFSENGKIGLVNIAGKVLIKAKYDDISVGAKAVVFRNQKKYGLADFTGKTLIDAQFDNFTALNDNFFRVQNSGKYGIVRFDGRGIANPVYSAVNATELMNIFSVEGFRYKMVFDKEIKKNKKNHITGYINSLGEILLDTLFYPEKIDADLQTGLIKAAQDSGVLVVNFENNGKLIEKTKYTNYIFIKNNPIKSKKNIWQQKDGLWGLFTYNGRAIFSYQFSSIFQNYFEIENAVVVDVYSNMNKTVKYGIVDEDTGKYILSPDYDLFLYEDFKYGSVARCVNIGKHFRLIGKNANPVGKYYGFIGEFKGGFSRFDVGGNIVYKDSPKKTLEINAANGNLKEIYIHNCPDSKKQKQFCTCTGGKWGIMDSAGTHVAKAEYDFLQEYFNGVFLAEKKGKWGVISHLGTVKIDFKFDELDYIADDTTKQTWEKIPFYKAKIKNRCGVIDTTGRFVIQPEFSDIFCIENSGKPYFITVRKLKQGLCGIIDSDGNNILFPTYNEIGLFSENTAKVKGFYNRWGFIDGTGKLIIDTSFVEVRDFKEGIAAVKLNEGWNFIDKSGKLLLNQFYQKIGDFNNGLAPFGTTLKKRRIFATIFYKSEGYINAKGEIVIKPKFTTADEFDGDFAIVVQNKKTGIIDRNGRFVVKPEFDYIEWNPKTGKYGAINSDNFYLFDENRKTFDIIDSVMDLQGFSDFFEIKFKKKIGIYFPDSDKKNSLKKNNELQFSELEFSEGKAAYKVYNLFGLYDISGKQIAETKYFEITPIAQGIFRLKNISEIIYIKPNSNQNAGNH